MATRADTIRQLIEELGTLDERRGHLRAQLHHLLDEQPRPARAPRPAPARPTLVAAPTRRRGGRPPKATAAAPAAREKRGTTTPGLRLFIEQTAARKGLDLATAARGEFRADVIAKYPGVPEDVLMARLSNNLKALRDMTSSEASGE